MTNKELISYECGRLEDIREYLIEIYPKARNTKGGLCIKELGEIIYELTEKITDTKVELVLGKIKD